MKTHEFKIEIMTESPLLGLLMSHCDTKNQITKKWNPTMKISLGFVFFHFTYTNIDYTVEKD
tara:strand:- start:1514 stop:1699 length:186 start_codon:yes stop_codon:yes gene_type:complete